jgi:hypothetical protein
MNYPNKAVVNEKGLFFGFVSENTPKREFPFELSEVEITEANFKQIQEIQKQRGAAVLVDGAFVNKKAEVSDFTVNPGKVPTSVVVNEKGLFYGFVHEKAANYKFPFEVRTVEITEENFHQIREVQKQMGAPVLIDGAFVNKKEELKDYLVAPTPKTPSK